MNDVAVAELVVVLLPLHVDLAAVDLIVEGTLQRGRELREQVHVVAPFHPELVALANVGDEDVGAVVPLLLLWSALRRLERAPAPVGFGFGRRVHDADCQAAVRAAHDFEGAEHAPVVDGKVRGGRGSKRRLGHGGLLKGFDPLM